jgi:hypothetical protein
MPNGFVNVLGVIKSLHPVTGMKVIIVRGKLTNIAQVFLEILLRLFIRAA